MHDAAGARSIRGMKSTLSPRRPLVFATVAALTLSADGCRRREIRAPAPDTSAPPAPVEPAINSAQRLVDAMRDRYNGKWYSTLTFVQSSTFYRPDGSVLRSETWPESAMMPGRLRIDIGNPSIGNAVIYANDTVYQFTQRRLTRREPGNNPLQVLGFDVYHLPPSRAIEILSSLGYDLSTMVPAGEPTMIQFRASRSGTFGLIVAESHIDVARITVGGPSP